MRPAVTAGIALATVLALVAMAASAGEVSFAGHSDVATGDNPSAVAAADFNLDRQVDLAVANHTSGNISVLLGNNDATFTAVEPVVLEAGVPAALVVASMDEDRRMDLIATSDADSSVTILLGNGDGTFIERSRTRVGEGPEGLVIADFNGDGHLDVATANSFGNSVSVALGVGNGTLLDPTTMPVGRGPCGIDAGDLDGDGRIDLALTLQLGDVVVTMLGNGDGTFRGPCVGDCGGNGRVTIDELIRGVNSALGNASVDACPAFDRNADGSVTIDELIRGVNSALNGCTVAGLLAGVAPAGIVVADVDGDEQVDLAVANEGSEFVSVLFGFGDGTFDTSQDFLLGALARGLAVNDIDGDGLLDLITANRVADSVSVLVGTGGGGFGTARSFAVGMGPSGGLGCQGLAIADVDGDHRNDVVTANDGDGSVSVLRNETPVAP